MTILTLPTPPRQDVAPGECARQIVDVAPGGPLVLVMRDDTAHCVHEFGKRLNGRAALPWPQLVGVLSSSYQLFQREVRAELARLAGHPGEVEFHIIDAVALEHAVQCRIAGKPVISLDPLFLRAPALRLSRGFLLGGTRSAGLVARPCARPIEYQLTALQRSLAGVSCTLVEDDVYTGGTLREAIHLLRTAGIRVARVVPGIHVTAASSDAFGGVTLDPAIEYRVPGLDALNLFDPRNFLLGISGLVVRLPDGTWGRAPYWLPFVSTAARTGIARMDENTFALSMVNANARFFARVESGAHCLVRVGDMHPSVRRLLITLRLAEERTPVRSAVDRVGENLDRFADTLLIR